jgi:hypothetical protein
MRDEALVTSMKTQRSPALSLLVVRLPGLFASAVIRRVEALNGWVNIAPEPALLETGEKS